MKKRTDSRNRPSYLRWCYECNVPLLRKKCDLCGGKGIAVAISSPGDARPALEEDRLLVVRTISEEYGPQLKRAIKGKIIILNKAPGIDRTDEIIIDGIKIGVLEFDIFEKKFRFIPSIEGCAAFDRFTKRKIMVKGGLKGHLKGKYLSYDDIIIPKGHVFEAGDYAILLFPDGNIGKGILKDGFQHSEKAIKILDMTKEDVYFSKITNPMEKIIKANRGHLNIIEKEASDFIKETIETSGKPVNVAFSGGKDSLVILELVKGVTNKSETIFIDTGLEFPETVAYVGMMQKKAKKKIRCVRSTKDLLTEAEVFGPPAKDYRWCCKTHKLAPVAEYIGLNYPDGCLTFEGKRRYESFSRALSRRVDNNPFVPGQTSAYPILEWRSLEVWLFIFSKGLRYNSLYDKGFERVGCWMCPAGLDSEFEKAKELHPEKHRKFYKFLLGWADSRDLGKKYVRLGFWRWKSYPKKMLEIARDKDINLVPHVKKEDYKISSVSGVVPCHDRKFSIEAVLNGIKDFERLGNVLNVLGSVSYSKDMGALRFKSSGCDVSVFASGHIMIKSDSKVDAKRALIETARTIIRFETCNMCGICARKCEKKAISVVDEKIHIGASCTHCGKCNRSCQTYVYSEKVVDMSRVKKV